MYAIVDNTGKVVNIVLWDGKSELEPPEGCSFIPIPSNSGVGIGWTYDAKAGSFAVPASAAAPPFVGPRTVLGAVLVHVLDKATKVCPRDLAYVAGLSAAREDMASLARIAAVDGRSLSAWFDAALAP